MKCRFWYSRPVLAGLVAVGVELSGSSAFAQDAARLQAIERQIRQLEAEVRSLKADAARRDAALQQARRQATEARRQATKARRQAVAAPAHPAAPSPTPAANLVVPPGTPPGSAVVTMPPNDRNAAGQPFYNPRKPSGKFNVGPLTITLGGFFDTTGYYRSRNENRGVASSFGGIPFTGPTAQGDAGELDASAQGTRLSLRVDATPFAGAALTGYVESDFLNGAGGANSVSSNSYTPRLRHAFIDLSYAPWHGYILAGQTWSLATPFKKGLDPFHSWQPPVIDYGYMVGYNVARMPVLRVVKSIGPAWFGLEIAEPQTVFGGSAVPPAGGSVVTGYPGNGGLNPQAEYSVNTLPDVVGKVAIDTGFGHYEVFGLLRRFEDQVTFPTGPGAGTVDSHASLGGGFGASAIIPLGSRLDLVGTVLSGSGVGRYGASGLPDVTYAAAGSLKPLHETMATFGAVGHLGRSLDVYALAGIDEIGRSAFGATGGYGNPGANNAGCFNPNAGDSGCAGNNFRLTEFTAGYSWTFLRGGFGSLQTGLQYAYVKREAYRGTGGAPTGIDNMVLVNLRYMPFQ